MLRIAMLGISETPSNAVEPLSHNIARSAAGVSTGIGKTDR